MSGEASEATEVEWQFDALDLRPVERWLASLPSRVTDDGLPTLTALAKPPRRLVDRYLDTEDRRVGQAGFVLRVRRRGRLLEATMKDTRPAGTGGLRQRLEVTEPLPPAGIGALGPEGPVGRRLAAVAGKRALVDVLEVRTRRQPFSLRAAGAEVAEVALDDTTIVVGSGQRPAHLRRVEVEVDARWVDALGPVVEDLRAATGLRPATLSKFEAGLLAAGIDPPGPPDLGPTAVGPSSTMGEVAFAVLRRHLGVLLAKEPGTRLGDDIEELHDMRVATRRLRAAMDLFSDVLPPRAQQLRDELRWLAGELGAVRDLDVQLEGMGPMREWVSGWADADHSQPLDLLAQLLEDHRAAARRDLLDALDSPRWARLSDALVALARQGPNRRLAAARVPAAIAVPPLVVDRHRSVVTAARKAHKSGLANDFHRLRIRCKRLRYSLEFTAGLYGSGTQPFVRKLTKVQDVLGRMQDAEVATDRLYRLATVPADRDALPPATVFVMGGVAAHYRHESSTTRRSAARHLGVLNAKAWSDVVAVMDRARARSAAAWVAPVPAARPGAPRQPIPPDGAWASPNGASSDPPFGTTVDPATPGGEGPAEGPAETGAGPVAGDAGPSD